MLKLPLKVTRFAKKNGLPWTSCLPFVDNKRAQLIHRPMSVTKYKCGSYPSHLAVHCWCGQGPAGSDKFTFLEKLDGSKLLCAKCETNAVAAGLPSAYELSGLHVHVGKVVAVQTCCTEVK